MEINKSLILALTLTIFVLSGCATIFENSSGQNLSDSSTSSGTIETSLTHSQHDQSTTNPTSTSKQQLENTQDGERFALIVERLLDRRDGTDFVSATSFPNGTIDFTFQIQDDRPLYWSMMDGTQAISAVTYHGTYQNETFPRYNGTDQRLHEPVNIRVAMLSPDAKYLGSFEIDPQKAREYRSNQRSAYKFSNDIVYSYESDRFYKRGNVQPSHYLNRSELSMWARDYVSRTRNWSDGLFDSPFPTDNIRMNSSSNYLLHQFNWTRSEYGQVADSAYSTSYTAYWRTAGSSMAKAPKRLYIYIERPNKNRSYAAYMNRQDVYILLESNLDPANRSAYLERDKGGFIDSDENPYRNIFYTTSESNATED